MNINNLDNSPKNIQPMTYITPKEQMGLFDIKLKLQEIIENLISTPEASIDEQLNEKFLELDFGAEFDIDASKIGVNDAIFFVNLLNSQNMVSYTVEEGNIKLNANEKTINATRALLNVLDISYSTKKPVRLDFDNNITVIIKLDNKGKVQAHFIPGTNEAESFLKNNIPDLKQRFDNEKINYSYIGYQGNKNQKNKKRSSK